MKRTCRKCNKDKLLYEFGTNKKMAYGYASICNDCKQIERDRNWRQGNDFPVNYEQKQGSILNSQNTESDRLQELKQKQDLEQIRQNKIKKLREQLEL